MPDPRVKADGPPRGYQSSKVSVEEERRAREKDAVEAIQDKLRDARVNIAWQKKVDAKKPPPGPNLIRPNVGARYPGGEGYKMDPKAFQGYYPSAKSKSYVEPFPPKDLPPPRHSVPGVGHTAKNVYTIEEAKLRQISDSNRVRAASQGAEQRQQREQEKVKRRRDLEDEKKKEMEDERWPCKDPPRPTKLDVRQRCAQLETEADNLKSEVLEWRRKRRQFEEMAERCEEKTRQAVAMAPSKVFFSGPPSGVLPGGAIVSGHTRPTPESGRGMPVSEFVVEDLALLIWVRWRIFADDEDSTGEGLRALTTGLSDGEKDDLASTISQISKSLPSLSVEDGAENRSTKLNVNNLCDALAKNFSVPLSRDDRWRFGRLCAAAQYCRELDEKREIEESKLDAMRVIAAAASCSAATSVSEDDLHALLSVQSLPVYQQDDDSWKGDHVALLEMALNLEHLTEQMREKQGAGSLAQLHQERRDVKARRRELMLRAAGAGDSTTGNNFVPISPRPLPRPEWVEELARNHHHSLPEHLTPSDLHRLLMAVQSAEASDSRGRKGQIAEIQKVIEDAGCDAVSKDGQAEVAEEQNEQLAREIEEQKARLATFKARTKETEEQRKRREAIDDAERLRQADLIREKIMTKRVVRAGKNLLQFRRVQMMAAIKMQIHFRRWRKRRKQEESTTTIEADGNMPLHYDRAKAEVKHEAEAKAKASTESSSSGPTKINVWIISAKGLKNADMFGKNDPYVICQLNQKTKEKRFQTKVLDNAGNDPQWHHGPEALPYSNEPELEFLVCDKDLTSSDFLGRAVLHREQFLHGEYEGELSLTSKDGKTAVPGSLRVKVQPVGAGVA